MGLNLYVCCLARSPGAHEFRKRTDSLHNSNIRRVVFSDISKYDGYAQRHLSESEVKQIAGRAGRFNGAYPKGLVSCFQPSHLDFVQNALLAPLEETPVLPSVPALALHSRACNNSITIL